MLLFSKLAPVQTSACDVIQYFHELKNEQISGDRVERGSYLSNSGSVYTNTFSDRHGFMTASKSMRFGSAYTEPFLPENPSRDGISERCTTC